MELTHADVLEILALLEGSDVDYLELDIEGTRIVADRHGSQTPVPERDPARPPSRPAPEPPPQPRQQATRPTSSAEEGPPEGPAHGADVVPVTAPVVGVFYRSPEPGAPPFTEVGARVEMDSTVGLVEVMKMFNGVTAGVRGRVVEIFVANDSFVEYGQVLMTIRPEPAE